jgi:hypothetical protein
MSEIGNAALIFAGCMVAVALFFVAAVMTGGWSEAKRNERCVQTFLREPDYSHVDPVRLAVADSPAPAPSADCDPGSGNGQWVFVTECSGACTQATRVRQWFPNDGTQCPGTQQTVSCASSAPCMCSIEDWQSQIPDAQPCAGTCDNARPGDQCQLSCNAGLVPAGNNTITCLGDGTWGIDSDYPFACAPQLQTCPRILANAATQILVGDGSKCVGAQPGDVCQFACHVGFAPFEAGVNSVTCFEGQSGVPQWTQSGSLCVPENCYSGTSPSGSAGSGDATECQFIAS